jgi:hypothetical protein
VFKVVLTTLLLLCSAAELSVAEFLFTDGTTRKLGKVSEGENITFDYPFTNKGASPLTITETKVACPCTVVDFPKNPIVPGGKGNIHVTFDTKGKIGYQDRTIEVYSNAKKNPIKLRFKVDVKN